MLEKALSLHQKGQLAEAATLYRKILAQNPKNADALHLLGVIEAQRDNSLAAIDLIDRALKLSPNNAGFLSNRGLALQKLKRFADALASYDRALAIKPNYAEALNNRGLALQELKRFDDALESYARALAIKPNYDEALYNRGRALQELKRFPEALNSYDHALAIKADHVLALNNRGLVLQGLKRFDDALSSYGRALEIKPDYAEALNNRGLALQALKRLDEALASYDCALAIKPDYAEAFYNRGHALQELKRLDDALASYGRALVISPDYVEALNDRGLALQDLRRLDEALASYDHALAIKLDYTDALNNRGLVLQELKRFDDSLASYDRALAIKPDHADVLYNRGIARLLGGHLREGWADYEWRWKTKEFLREPVNAQEWQGEEIDGRSILIFTEQGRGDIIQFARYLPLLVQRGARVSFFAPAEVIRLFRSLDAEIKLISSLSAGDPFDFQSALMSLPLRFGTDVLSIPNEVPYLRAERDLVTRWKARIGEHGFKIGIAWQGSPQGKVDQGRSIPVTEFVPLSSLSGVRLISLQKQHGLDQLAGLPQGAVIEVLGEDFDQGPDAFIDTAAIMENLDLIITSDTSIAHLAGALARPTWVALKFVPDWRWMLDRRDSPWYPTMRLFRQETAGDWQFTFSTIEQELLSLLGSPDATPALGDYKHVARNLIQAARQFEQPIETNREDRRPLLESENLRIKRCKHGLMMFHTNDDYVGRSLDTYGEFSERKMELFDRILRPGMTVVDVGANIGVHTIYFAKTVGPSGQVFAFEPQRVHYQMLCGNIALNRYGNVVAVNVGLASELGTVRVPEIDYAKGGNFGGIFLGKTKNGEEVPAKTLDSYGLKSCHLIKINLEGMEQAVLKGAKMVLERHKPLLYVENDRADKSKDLIQWLLANGYRLYWHRLGMFNSHNHFAEAENIFGNIVSVNIFCVPRSKSIDVRDFVEITS